MAAKICASGQRRFAELFLLKLIKWAVKLVLNHCLGNTWTMCEFHESTCNGFGDIWWTDNPIYFSRIDTYMTFAFKTRRLIIVYPTVYGNITTRHTWASCCRQPSLDLLVIRLGKWILCDVFRPLSQLFESHDRRPKFDSVPHPENDYVYMDFLPLTWRYVNCQDCLQHSCIETLNFTMNIPFIQATQPKLKIIKQHTLTLCDVFRPLSQLFERSVRQRKVCRCRTEWTCFSGAPVHQRCHVRSTAKQDNVSSPIPIGNWSMSY